MRRALVIIIVLLALGVGAWFYFSQTTTAPAGQTISNTSPFGTGEGSVSDNGAGTDTNSTSTSNVSSIPTAHLYKLSDAPVAGAVAFTNKAGALMVRYVERATGHIIEIDPISLAKTEIVNTTVPKVYEALWKKDGSAVIMRTLAGDNETILSTSISLTPPAGTSTSDTYTTKSASLVSNIDSISGYQNAIFYTIKNQPQIISALFDGTKAATIWSNPFTDWTLHATSDSSALLVAKASAQAQGYAYTLRKSGVPQKILGPFYGLSAVESGDFSHVVYSYSANGITQLAAKNLSTGATSSVTPITLADKCVWSTKGVKYGTVFCAVPIEPLASDEPDNWYQGTTHYTDRIWRFDTDTNFSLILSEPKKDYNLTIDAEHLFLSPAEDYLFFQNKNDLSLWALKLD